MGKIADRLNLDYREIHVSSYEGKAKSAPRIVRTIADAGNGAGFLIVDDVVDSGDTALFVHQLFPAADFVSVYGKREGLRKVEVGGMRLRCAERFAQELWIVFPWDQPGWTGEMSRAVAAYRRASSEDKTARTG